MGKTRATFASDYFKKHYKFWKNLSVKDLYLKIMWLFEYIIHIEPPKAKEDYTDRDYLEVAIEALKFVHCHIYKIDYASFNDNTEELGELGYKNKLLKHLFDLKFELYGEEIFEELGLKIVGKVGNGLIVEDSNKYS